MDRRLELTDEQRVALLKFKKAYHDLVIADVGLASFGNGRMMYAYNKADVDCFAAPTDAAYDNPKEEVDITELEEFLLYGLVNYDHTESNKTFVVFN